MFRGTMSYMCGIFAYAGTKRAAPILLDGLTALEYRGYDSAGVYLAGGECVKAVGPVRELRAKMSDDFLGTVGIAHTRWATHGEPTESNAHPHHDCSETLWVVHNGIVENFKELRDILRQKGHVFVSETDTEVIVHLIEEYQKDAVSLERAVVRALQDIRGTYGLVVSSKHDADKIIVARMGAPMLIGLGEGENFAASDPSPLLRYTSRVLYLNDREMAVITHDTHRITTFDDEVVARNPETLEWNVEEAQKGGFEHFMLKEIMEEPEVVRNTCRGRLIADKGLVKLGGLESVAERLRSIKRIVIVGCGTAYYSGLVGEYMLEEYAGIPVEVEIGSEFRYRKPLLDKHTMLLAVSQSGETADTLEAIREAQRRGVLTIGIVNAVGSSIARETDAGIYNHAGPEIGVASTKAFVSQMTAFALLTVFLGRQRSLSLEDGIRITKELACLPEKIATILESAEAIKQLAERYKDVRDFFYIGRKYSYPIALEGALKLKEVSYIHAEGYGAGEMKHGPLAMIDENFPTMAIVPKDSVYEKTISNIQEIRARKGPVIAVVTEGDTTLNDMTDATMVVPQTIEMLSPIVSVLPLQLFAYYVSLHRGIDVDRPRNLAKSVTVE